MSNAKLPINKYNSTVRRRIIINRTGDMWKSWYKVTDNGTLWLDEQGYGQYPQGEWRYIIECEVKKITYEECNDQA